MPVETDHFHMKRERHLGFADDQERDQYRDCLGSDGCPGGSGSSHMEHIDEQKVAENVNDGRNRYGHQRYAGIADAPEQGPDQVIENNKDQTEATDADIVTGR